MNLKTKNQFLIKNQFKEIENIFFFQEISKLVISVYYYNFTINTWYNNLYQKLNPSKAFHPLTFLFNCLKTE
jgi:hypothetical protein